MKHHHIQRGFTLVETLVAIVVLTLAMAGPLYIAQQSITTARVSKDRTTASFLAQEGLEHVRAARDTNYLLGRDWLAILTRCTGNGCIVDATRNSPFDYIASCSSTCSLLRYDTTQHWYNHRTANSVNTNSRFRRSIYIEETVPDREAEVTVEVTWQDRGRTYTTRVSETILNWL